jgi:uncharacterized protein DUF6194
MNEESIVAWITGAFDRVQHLVKDGNSFFSFDPEHMHPFATLVTNNINDSASDLDRPGVYRLNVGVRKETWVGMFGPPTKGTPGDYGLGSGSAADWDFTALDTLMPHPVYGRMHWVCVLNPSEATFEKIKPLLAEAYEIDVVRTQKKQSRNASLSTKA